MTSVVLGTSGNPPLAIPLTFTGTIRLDNAINIAGPAGLAPQSIDHDFDNAYMQSWNLNVQHDLGNFVLMAGYIGSKGTHLITRRNINQPVNGVRPLYGFVFVQSDPSGHPLGNITQGREFRQLQLQRPVGYGHETTCQEPSIRRVVYLVQVA
jgi:hypothetical protein